MIIGAFCSPSTARTLSESAAGTFAAVVFAKTALPFCEKLWIEVANARSTCVALPCARTVIRLGEAEMPLKPSDDRYDSTAVTEAADGANAAVNCWGVKKRWNCGSPLV